MLKKLALTAFTFALLSTNANAGSTSIFAGTSLAEGSNYTYIGGVTALNSNLDKDGFLARALVGVGGYDYSRAPSSDVNGRIVAGDVMLGYQTFLAKNPLTATRLTFYVGVDHQDQHLSPYDPASNVRGPETGVKGQIEAAFQPTTHTNLNVLGSYSSAYDTYWLKTQYGCNELGVNIGPEVVLLGNKAFDQQRYGAFVNEIPLASSLSAGISGGYSNSARRGEDGLYGEVGLAYSF